MARHEDLPIYRKTFELAVYIEHSVAGFPRRFKYGLGLRLQRAVQDVVTRVVRAQNRYGSSKAPELEELRVEVEVLKSLLHLAKEVSAFKSFNAWYHAAGLAVEIGRQTEGWLKHSSSSRPPESRPVHPEEGGS